MAKYMIREEITRILLLQKQSNLTVTDFCRNEGYNRSQFYDRRLRFGVTDEGVDQSSGYNSMDAFAPVCINSATLSPSQPRPVPLSSKPEKQAIKGSDSSEICLELLNGIKMKFKGTGGCKAALSLITKLCGSCFA